MAVSAATSQLIDQAAQSTRTQSAVAGRIAARQLDTQRQTGEALVQLIDQAGSVGRNQAPSRGIDVRA